MTDVSDPGEIYSVSQLVNSARDQLERVFSSVVVEGEISNLARPRSGHVYFTLKDADAQLRCALFRREAVRLRFHLEDGQKVLVHGRISVYPARGDLQLYVSSVEQAGFGALQKAFEQLKERLLAEGLFDPERKREVPRFPRRIAIVSSATGAALRDILNVLQARWPLASVLIYPTQVQGTSAAGTIVKALKQAAERHDSDVLILARGGGSLEDLWPFNEEIVARQIREMPMPVVTGVGHETDFTIADFVADLRAPTPSAAAAAVVPDQIDVVNDLEHRRSRISQAFNRMLEADRVQLSALSHRLQLQHPRRRIEVQIQRLDELARRLLQSPAHQVSIKRGQLADLRLALLRCSPRERLHRNRLRLETLKARLWTTMRNQLASNRQVMQIIGSRLSDLSPQQTLARGYAIIFDEAHHVLLKADQVGSGERVTAQLSQGKILARVERTVDETQSERGHGPISS